MTPKRGLTRRREIGDDTWSRPIRPSGRLDRLEDARVVNAELPKNAPDYTLEMFRLNIKGKFITPADEKRFIDDLRKAGLPE